MAGRWRGNIVDVQEIATDVVRVLASKLSDLENLESKASAPDNQIALTRAYFDDFDKFVRCQEIPSRYFTDVEPGQTVFISHRWKTPGDPDPDQLQFNKVKEWLGSNYGVQSVWYDFCCMPQKPRTPSEDQIFKDRLGTIDQVTAVCQSLAYLTKDYMERSWCFAEFAMSNDLTTIGEEQKSALMDKDFFAWPLFIYHCNNDAGHKFLEDMVDVWMEQTAVTNQGDKAVVKKVLMQYMTKWKPSYLHRFELLKDMMNGPAGDNLINLGNMQSEFGDLFNAMHKATLALEN